MALSPADNLKFAEQALAVDQQRLMNLTAQKHAIAANGGDTTQIDSAIAGLREDVVAGQEDLIKAQADVEDQKTAEAGDTAGTAVENTEPQAGEALDNNEKSNLENKEQPGDGPDAAPTNDNGGVTDSNPEQRTEPVIEKPTTVSASAVPVAGNPDDEALAQEKALKHNKSAVGANTQVPTYIPRDNPLHQYATYTYSMALYILSSEDVNLLTSNPSAWKPNSITVKGQTVNTCLIASGGKTAGQYKRNSNFTDDFYFDNLKMTTVIGMNSRSKSTNAVEIGFGILEPYGMSLLDRIIEAAADVQAPNFKAMPYLLEVEFYGYDDNGKQILIENQRKRIPIQIIELKIKVGTKGAEYAVKAVPWNHQALSQSAASTPINIEVKASTVGEFFKNNLADQLAVTQQDADKVSATSKAQRRESDLKAAEDADRKTRQEESDRNYRAVSEDPGATPKVSPSVRKPEDQTELSKLHGVVNRAFAVSSYCGGVNAWFNDLVFKKLRGTRDQIMFDIHPDIAKTKIVVPDQKDITKSATRDDKPVDAAAAAAKDANRVFTDAQAFPISSGTSITQVIDMIMRNSEYITSQVKDPKNMTPQDIAEREGRPLHWYKVVPTIQVGEYDYVLNKFSTITTYHIQPYIVYDSKHPQGPVAPPQGAMKKYNYSYTGKNIDILDFSIDFDTLFYTAVTAGAAKWQSDIAIEAAKQQTDTADRIANENPEFAKELVNRQLRLVPELPQTGGSGAKTDVKQVAATDIQKGQYSNSRGDMLNLKLKIVGDPELIKQDDIYTNPSQGGYDKQINTTGIMSDNGSVPMDNGEVMCEVTFKTILDMDDTKGTPDKNPKYENNSIFSGVYRILTVENVFQNGKFEQTVDMVRMPDTINNATKNAGAGKPVDNSQSMSVAAQDAKQGNTVRIPETASIAIPNYRPVNIDSIKSKIEAAAAALMATRQEEGIQEPRDETSTFDEQYLAEYDIPEAAPVLNIDDYVAQESTDPESPVPRSFFTSTIS
jgi:hypothetical protein